MSKDRLIVRRRIGDIETPVSAMLKLGPETPGSSLFESIHGGERLGRYSFVGVDPLKWFRVKDGKAEQALSADFVDSEPLEGDPITALRRFVSEARAVTDVEGLPPIVVSGATGRVGAAVVKQRERERDAGRPRRPRLDLGMIEAPVSE